MTMLLIYHFPHRKKSQHELRSSGIPTDNVSHYYEIKSPLLISVYPVAWQTWNLGADAGG